MSSCHSIEEQFIKQISDQLRLFSHQPSGSYRFLCPYCQSGHQNNKGKPYSPSDGKGFLYKKGGAWFFKCHKCTHGTTFEKFLSEWFSSAHLDYVSRREELGLTGFQTNCPSIKTVLKDKGILYHNAPEFCTNKQKSKINPTSSTNKNLSVTTASKTTVLPPVRSPQQQAGYQSPINYTLKQREMRRRREPGDYWLIDKDS